MGAIRCFPDLRRDGLSAQDDRRPRQGRARVYSEELREAFLGLVRETGSAHAAGRALGHAQLFYKRMRRDAGLRARCREAALASGRRPAERRASVRWSVELGEAFLVLLGETGNARQAAIALGAPHAFANRMKRCPEFRRRAMAAAAEADERWRGYEGPFLPRLEVKSMPPGDGSGDGDGGPPPPGRGRRRPPPSPWTRPRKVLETDADALGGMLRPGRKRKPSRPQPVLRRNSRGRMQVSFAREGHWTQEIEDDFLRRLAATGNFDACARAVGFQPASVHERERKWPAFARACQKALEEADVALVYVATAFAHSLLRRPGEAAEAGIVEEETPFDPAMAMKILAALDARKYGRSGKGRRKGPPERSAEQAIRSILDKIEAIERHERRSDEKLSHESDGGGSEAASGGSRAAPIFTGAREEKQANEDKEGEDEGGEQ